MARTKTEHVTITASELAALRRDAAILDMVEADYRAKRPGGLTIRSMFGGLLESKSTMQGILAAHVRRLDAREPSPDLDRVPARSRA
jgi:hypothetical protein